MKKELYQKKRSKKELGPTKKRKWVAFEKEVQHETSVAKAIKEIHQIPSLTLPAAKPLFLGDNNLRKENPLLTRYSVANKEMICQMGYELQSPIELKDEVGNFEPIPCCKNSNIRDPQDKADKMYDIGFPVRRGGDKPVVVTIHGK